MATEHDDEFRKNLTEVFQAAQNLAPEALKRVTNAILNDVDKDRVILLDVASEFDPNTLDIGSALKAATKNSRSE